MHFILLVLQLVYFSSYASAKLEEQVETLEINPWTLNELGSVEIPKTINIQELTTSISNDKTIEFHNALHMSQETPAQKKSIIVHVMQGISTGIRSKGSIGFLNTITYLKHNSSPHESHSFIFGLIDSLHISYCNGRTSGFWLAFYNLDSQRLLFKLVKSVMECVIQQRDTFLILNEQSCGIYHFVSRLWRGVLP
jgi:hypothetical protein